MAIASIDTLQISKQLKGVGFTEEQAEAMAGLLKERHDSDLERLVTRDVLRAELAMLRGEVRDGDEALRVEISQLREEIAERFAAVDARFAGLEKRFASIDVRFGELEKRFASIDVRFEKVDKDIAALRGEIARLDDKIDRVEERLTAKIDKLEQKLTVKLGGMLVVGFTLMAAFLRFTLP